MNTFFATLSITLVTCLTLALFLLFIPLWDFWFAPFFVAIINFFKRGEK